MTLCMKTVSFENCLKMCARSVVGVTDWIICHIFLPAKFGGAKKTKKQQKKKKEKGKKKKGSKTDVSVFLFLVEEGAEKKRKESGKTGNAYSAANFLSKQRSKQARLERREEGRACKA